MADFTPVVGDVKGVYDTKKAYDEGDFLGAGINAVATGIGVIPLIGDAAGKGLKAGAAAMRGTDELFPVLISKCLILTTWKCGISLKTSKRPMSGKLR